MLAKSWFKMAKSKSPRMKVNETQKLDPVSQSKNENLVQKRIFRKEKQQ